MEDIEHASFWDKNIPEYIKDNFVLVNDSEPGYTTKDIETFDKNNEIYYPKGESHFLDGKKIVISDTSEDIRKLREKEYSYTDEQEKLFNDFKLNLCERMQPVIQNLVIYLRHLEKENTGDGKSEVRLMLDNKDINQSMYELLMETLEDLSKEYIVNLSTSKYFN